MTKKRCRLGEYWHNHGISARIAYASMILSHEEWVKFHADTDQDQVWELAENLFKSGEFLKSVAQMIEVAHTRLRASACAALEQGVIGDGKQPIRLEGWHNAPVVSFNEKALRS